jgi:LPS-assembly protein
MMRTALALQFFVGVGVCLGVQLGASAQQALAGDALILRASPMLIEKPSPESLREAPAFVSGQSMTGQTDVRLVIEGSAQLRRGPVAVRAQRLDFEETSQKLKGDGAVRVSRMGNVFSGQELSLRMDTFEGFFIRPQYRFLGGGQGQAQRFDFQGQQRMTAQGVSYTTCERDNEESWKPPWEFTADQMDFDFEAEAGRAQNLRLRFYDTTILAWPGSISFPLSDKRKSGVLPPTYAVDTISGLTLSVPYYLDIAPNRDATLTPTAMTKRGLDLGLEARYLERSNQGMLRLNFLPNDRITHEQRWAYSLQNQGRLDTGVASVGTLSYTVNLNRVSDDDYWRDFPRQNKALTQRLLPSDVSLGWSAGQSQASLRVLQWQTLQDVLSPIVPPYDRLPQLAARHSRSFELAQLPLQTSIDADFTRFSALRSLTSQTNADRLYTRAQLSSPWVWPAGYFVPKLQLHATQYSFEEVWRGQRSAGRSVPILSVDSGLVFERQSQFLGQSFLQTLEPRAFYVYTPWRDQSRLPNYDSAENSFSFATLFTENSFVGNDRIADTNLVTLGLTSRLLLPETGSEMLRLGMAQRIRFADQRVTLDGSPPAVQAERISDLMIGATVNASDRWALDWITQYNPKRGESQRMALSARYHPSPYRLLSAAYRLQRPVTTNDTGSQQVDLGWQWPINDLWGDRGQNLGPGRGQGGQRWYSVGRLNYSATEGRLVDAVMGLEYDGCCWVGRAVYQRSYTSLARTNSQIMLQLEFVGFSRIGNNPLGTLKSNIPRYQYLRDQVTPPSRYSNYD